LSKPKKDKKPTDVIVGWVIDRSGSMGNAVQDTVDGFNAWVEEQRALPGNLWLSLTLFDNQFQTPLVAIDIREVPTMTAHQGSGPLPYYVGGSTALYDAVGVTITGIEGWLKNHPKFTGTPVVNVWTDGGENASQRWNITMLMDKIREKQAEGWQFSFLGSGGAAWTEGKNFAGTFGVMNTSAVNNNSSGRRMAYAGSSNAVKGLRSSGTYTSTAAGMSAAVMDSATLAAYGIDNADEALPQETLDQVEEILATGSDSSTK